MDFKKQLKDAEQQLLRLEQQKKGIERQMRGWIQIIEGLRELSEQPSFGDPLTGEEVPTESDTPSLPNKILLVLAEVRTAIGATQIRDQLYADGAIDVSTSKNLLINIHTTLKRLIKTGQVEEVPLEDSTKLYAYISPMRRALKLPYGATRSMANLMAAGIVETGQAIPPHFARAALKAAKTTGHPPMPPVPVPGYKQPKVNKKE